MLGLRGEATGKHKERENRRMVLESLVYYGAQALAVIQQFVSVWSLTS